ncbi:MAG: LPXTG cell wall anchor domain-containing protein [Bacillota bacterium]
MYKLFFLTNIFWLVGMLILPAALANAAEYQSDVGIMFDKYVEDAPPIAGSGSSLSAKKELTIVQLPQTGESVSYFWLGLLLMIIAFFILCRGIDKKKS